LLVVDFAPHELESLRSEHAHRRLGISTEQITGWFNRAGLALQQHELLPPPWLKEQTGLTVSVWLAVPKITQTIQAHAKHSVDLESKAR
jgi:hypothetical protein